MKLFLASYIRDPRTWSDMGIFVGGLADKRIAYIPTASNGEFDYGAWRESETYKQLLGSGAQVTAIELEAYKTPSQDISADLKNFDIIWMAGGMAGYLMYWIRRSRLDKCLPEILNTGTIYIGSSAGSVIVGKSLEHCEWSVSDSEYGAGLLTGLSLVNFSVYPHYNDGLLPEIKSKWSGEALKLLKDGEAICISDGKLRFIGEEREFKPLTTPP